MRFQCLICLIFASLAYGQTPPAAAPSAPAAQAGQNVTAPADKAPEVKVGPDEAVITLKGFCAENAPGDACKTVVTREQFEKLAAALQPTMSPAIRRNLAVAYARMLKMAAAAEKRGLDKGPRFEEMTYFARLQILSQELSRSMQDDSGKVTDEDIDAYYKKNESSYQQASFERIFVPRAKQIVNPVQPPKPGAPGVAAKPAPNQPPTEAQKQAAEEAMKKVAEDIHERAEKGEDPNKLQKEAYAAAGLPGSPLSTKMEKVRRTTLPVNHQLVMDLKPGEISPLITDPNSGYYIYKLISIETLPTDSVKTEIKNTLTSQKYRDDMQGFQTGADLNDAYFGAPRKLAAPQPKGQKAADLPAEDKD